MHQRCIPFPRHSSARTSSTAGTGVSYNTRVRQGTAREEESRGFVCRTQESDRAAPPTPAEVEVRAGAVLLGRNGSEHQATGTLPQQTTDEASLGYCLAGRQEALRGGGALPKSRFCSRVFQHPQAISLIEIGAIHFFLNVRTSTKRIRTGVTLANIS